MASIRPLRVPAVTHSRCGLRMTKTSDSLDAHHIRCHFGAARARDHLSDLWKTAKDPLDIERSRDGFGQRDAGQPPHLQREVAFFQPGHKLDAEPGSCPQADDEQDDRNRDRPDRPRHRPFEPRGIGASQAANDQGFLPVRSGPYEPVRQQRRHGDCEEQGAGQGHDHGERHWSEHLALDTGQGQDGHIHQNDDAHGQGHGTQDFPPGRQHGRESLFLITHRLVR